MMSNSVKHNNSNKPTIHIPDQLRAQRFIQTYNKRPSQKNWTLDPSLYTYNGSVWVNIVDESLYIDSLTQKPYSGTEVNNYSADEFIATNTTYGVLCGYNGLFVVDCDSKELDEFLHTIPLFQKTYSIRTAGSQLTHFYFIAKDTKHPTTYRVNAADNPKQRVADIQGVGTQVIGPGSSIIINVDDKIETRYYRPNNENQITIATTKQIYDVLEDFSKKTGVKISFNEFKKRHVVDNVDEYIEQDDVCKKIKDKIKIPDLLRLWGINTNGPVCETPFIRDSHGRGSLSFTDHVFHDFNTGMKGNVIQMYMQYNNIDFVTARSQLALLANVEIKDNDVLTDNFSFYYMTSEHTLKYSIFNKITNKVNKMKKTDIVDYVVYHKPSLYKEYGITEKNILKKRSILSSKIFSYLETDGNIEVIASEGFRPTNELTFEFDNEKYLNTYKAPKLHSLDIVKDADSAMFPNIDYIIKHLCKNDTKIYNYFMNWLSFQLQNPLVKLPTSFIFMGAHGTGKGVLKNLVLDYVFGHDNVTELTQNTIVRGWGDTLRRSRLIFADEINLNGKQHDEVCDRLKNNTTNPFITVDIKRMDSQKMQNFTHWIFTSNKELPFQIEEGDRRYIVVEQLKKIDVAYVENIDNNNNIKTHKKEVHAFYSHLMQRTPNYKELSKPLHTTEKEHLIQESYSNARKFIEDIRSFDTFADFLSEVQLKIQITDGFVACSEFYQLFVKWCQINNMMHANRNNFRGELNRVYSIESKHKRMLDSVKRAYDLNDILGRTVAPDDIVQTTNDDSTDEMTKDMQEFEV